jgi:BCD family chlorophyll transporter-like MFS transporter
MTPDRRSTGPGAFLGWLGIVRLGLVQAAIGALVVITTSTLNRVQVVELALPALLPGVLVAIHYFVQVLRPRLGYGWISAVGARRGSSAASRSSASAPWVRRSPRP